MHRIEVHSLKQYELTINRMRDLADSITDDVPHIKMKSIKADGGVTQNEFALQFASNMLKKPIEIGMRTVDDSTDVT